MLQIIKKLCIVVLLTGLSQFVNLRVVEAHSGGTDKYGCHAGSEPYHCHTDSKLNFDLKKYYRLNGLQSNGRFAVKYVRFSSCVHLNRRYLRGVASRSSKSFSEAQLVDRKLYSLNKHLDLDKNGVACGLLDVENARVSNFKCDQTTPSLGDGLSPQTSLKCVMPPQQAGDLGSGWKIEVLSRTPDASMVIKSEMPNDPPPSLGRQYYLIRFRLTNLTTTPRIFEAFRLKVTGVSGVFYDLNNPCGSGVIPNWLLGYGVVNPNQSIVGNLCWDVSSNDAQNLLVAYESSRYCNCNMYTWIDRITYVAP